ncbi:unnamed protein product, partial [Adineta steineri]
DDRLDSDDELSNHQNTPKRHLSTVSDWCVPPTS